MPLSRNLAFRIRVEPLAQSLEERGGAGSGLIDLAECVHIMLVMPHIAHRIEIIPGRKMG